MRLSSGQPWGQPSQDEIARVLHELAAGDTINVRWMDRLARSVADLTSSGGRYAMSTTIRINLTTSGRNAYADLDEIARLLHELAARFQVDHKRTPGGASRK